MPDQFDSNKVVNFGELIRKIFLIDGRIYKHYRLMAWFPTYMEMFVQSQILVMDDNEGGQEELMSQSEKSIFPKFVNYYLAIMAVSCYKSEYLLYLLQY